MTTREWTQLRQEWECRAGLMTPSNWLDENYRLFHQLREYCSSYMRGVRVCGGDKFRSEAGRVLRSWGFNCMRLDDCLFVVYSADQRNRIFVTDYLVLNVIDRLRTELSPARED